MTRPVVLIEFSPSGGLFQFAAQLGEALAEHLTPTELWTGPKPELVSTRIGFAIRPVLPTWHPSDGEARFPCHRLLRRPLRAGQLVLAWLVLGVRLLVTRPRCVVFSNWRFSFEPLFVALYSRLLPRTTFAMVAHEPFPRSDAKDTSVEKSGRLLNACFATAWRSLDVAFVLGSGTRQLVIERWHPKCDVVVIPHGDENALRRTAVDHVPTVEASGTGTVALFFGTWTAYKGIDDLLDAFALVRIELPDAQLVMAGAVGADIDLPSIVGRGHAIGNVEMRPGYVPSGQVASLLSNARLVVAPYVRASQSGVIHLAYTFARPVVATAIGDLSEVVEDGRNGLLVPSRDPIALSRAMLRLLQDPELANRMGLEGKNGIDGAWTEAAARVTSALMTAERTR